MNLEQVSEMAKRVASEHEALEVAKDDKAKAEDEHLREVVEAIKPALPAMASRVDGCAGPIKRAVLIDRPKRIYLGEEGDWFRVAQSEQPYVMTEAHVLDVLNLGSIVAVLVQNLYAQLGSREEVTMKIKDETRAILVLTSLLTAPARAKR